MPIIHNYFLEYAPDVWGYVDVSVNDDGMLATMRVGDQPVTCQSPSVYPAYDYEGTSKRAFWLAISESGFLYRLDYNPRLKTAPVAKQIFGVDLDKRFSRENILPKKRFIDGAFNQAVYQHMQEAGSDQYKKIEHKAALQAREHERRPSDLLSALELESKLVREADAVYREELLGTEEDTVFAKTQAFQKQCHASYINKAQTELQAIISEYPEDYVAFKQALIAYLDQHWQVIKGTPLSYTGLSEHPVTQLLVGIAEKLEAFDGEPAVSYLMPDVYIQSQCEAHIPSLDKQSLFNLLKTHILDEEGHYLLPVSLLLDKTAVLHEQSSALVSEHGFINPFFDANTCQDRTHPYVSMKDFERLFQHSGGTQALRKSYQRFDLAAHDDATLLGQLNHLVSVLKTNDANEGIGRETDVGEAVYTVAPNFIKYYRRLHPIGFHVNEDKLPSLREALGAEFEMGYILVQSGPDAGLHFLSRYDDDGRLRALEEPDRETCKPLCDGKTPARYPITVMARELFEDSPELRATLSHEHPTLIRIPTEEPGTYHVYGQQTDGRWDFQTMVDAGSIILPKKSEHEDWVLDYDADILQSPANIPEAIYTAIQTQGGHHEQRLMLDVLLDAFDAFKHGQPLEILKVIEAQTGHLDLEEFKQVPDAIRNPLNRLWQYLGNSGTNIAATETTATCVAMLKAQLALAVGAYTDTLKHMGWSAAEKEKEYDECVSDLRATQEVLAHALDSGHYQGIDIRSPSPEILRALGMTPKITGPDDFRWFCSFPPESINAFLSDPSNPDGSEPLQYILDNYEDFDALSRLLLEIPPAAYKIILTHIRVALGVDELHALLNFLGTDDKKDALLYAYQDQLTTIIFNGYQLGRMLKFLNEKHRDIVLDTFKSQFVRMIRNGRILGAVLSTLSVAQCGRVLDELKDKLTTMEIDHFELVFKLEEIFQPLNEDQCRVVLEVFADKLTMIISDHDKLAKILMPLNEGPCRLVLEALEDQLITIIPTKDELVSLLYYLNETQFTFVLEKIQNQVPAMFSSSFAIKSIFDRTIVPGNAKLLLPLVTHVFKSSSDIEQLPDHYRGPAIRCVKNMSPNNICTHWQLITMLEGCNDERFQEILTALKQNTTMMWYLQDKPRCLLHDVLEMLTPSRCEAFLMSKEHNELMYIVYINGLSNLLGNPRELTEEKIRLVIKHVGGDLFDLMHPLGLEFSLDGYAKLSKRCILEALEDALPDLITTRSTLDHVLHACGDDEQSVNLVLSSLKGRLNRLVSIELDHNRPDVIRASQTSDHGIFSSFTSRTNRIRSQKINVGALSSKLEKYSASRKLEGSFHWDFLGLMAFVYLISDWFSGEPWIKAKNTKLAAATYALHANNNEHACLVRLAPIDLLPNKDALKSSHANSYLLIGASDAPKQLCYVDYEGNTALISMTNAEGVADYFSEEDHETRLTYSEIHEHLDGHTYGLLPTDAQLAALKEGLLGDIMRDAGVDDILDGSKRLSRNIHGAFI